ncbi:MAG: hypothetical protein IJ408_03975 [Clostridia bacterium]|nr:hypothetical protein [Clostridia bacterium]
MHSRSKSKLSVRQLVIFALLGALMFTSKWVTEFLPNVHLLGVFTVAFTVHYRKKALYPISVFVLLMGLFTGFSNWWIPYLYLWFLLWGAVMLVPKGLSARTRLILYIVICSLHGFLYGTLYAPAHAIIMNLDFKQTLAWISVGFPWDVVHGVSNAVVGALLIRPIVKILKRIDKN